MNAKQRAEELYRHHIAQASVDGRAFRKLIMETLQKEFPGMSVASAATYYNNCKKAQPVAGLGRPPRAENANKKLKSTADEVDEECYSVLELVKSGRYVLVGRCQSFLYRGEAGETFDQKRSTWPNSTWVVIKGLGPASGEVYKLESDESELGRHEPVLNV